MPNATAQPTSQESLLKLFDPSMNTTLIGIPSIPDIRSLLERMLTDNRKMTQIVARELRHFRNAQQKTSLDTDSADLSTWSSSLNRSLTEVKPKLAIVENLQNEAKQT
ncbi:unnamed protein product [Bursaphelenchus okinawaensis]|uniref:Uncharacterized protein n=1 Tax=Bursaphelenchus okinawaensis TaxID=465554 RepID=A0A811KBN2_9BILA|nr:unnamed protein product [Bursaphelenchus okinawaensis]CAG9097602.1 unnamed protein product [Bursaphelenchus okinawaensis]